MNNAKKKLVAVRGAFAPAAGLLMAGAFAFGSPAEALPKAPSLGTFTDSQKAAAARESQADELRGENAHEECLPIPPEEQGLVAREGFRTPTTDNDTAHYCRGRTLIINLFINHTGGSWSTTEKEAAAAKNSVAKDYYIDNAPANANVHFDLEGTNGYWEYTGSVPYNISSDTVFTLAVIDDAIQSVGFGDGDGDGFFVDDLTQSLLDWNGGWDNVLLVAQPADITGRASASYSLAYTKIYTDDSANVRAHEWGHLFGSCDEYVENSECNGGINCGSCQSTYLTATIANGNCQLASCPTDVSCLMINNTFTGICPYTLEHWGWTDDDSNGLLDEVRRRLNVSPFFGTMYELTSGMWALWNQTTLGSFVYHQTWTSWSVAGLRSPGTADYDLHLYGDNDHRYQLASSSYGGSTIDLVVGDYNHSPLQNEHLEISRFSGDTANYRLQFESGTGVLYPDGAVRAGTWDATEVARVWDVPLFGGETLTFTLDVTSGTTDFGMALFKSSGGPYWAGRSSAQFVRDSGTGGVSEVWSYTVPSDDVYGLVIFANNAADGAFTIQIGPTPAALTEETTFTSGFQTRPFTYDPNASYWSVIGNRPTDGENTTVRLFDNSTYQTELETSNNYNSSSPSNIDFIAVDYNHVSTAIDYPRVIRDSGAGTHVTEWEHDADIMAGIMPTESWTAGHVGKVWDALLSTGATYMLRGYSGGIDQGLYFFGSSDSDYYKQRNAYDAAANFRPASEGEWVSFVPPATDWYGIVQLVNDTSSGSYANWLGREVVLSNDLGQTHTDQVVWASSAIPAGYWNAFGIRPSAGETGVLNLYGDDGYTITTLKSSDQTGLGVVNYVVGDYNHTPAETVYPRYWRSTGTGAIDVEADGGTETITYNGGAAVSQSFAWPAGDVVEAIDVFLKAGQSVRIQVNDLSGVMNLGVALFKSNNATYYANPTQAVDQSDVNGVGGSESFEYFVPADDFYGLIVVNQNDAGGNYEVIVGGAGAVGADLLVTPAPFELASSPNPFVDSSELRFSLPNEDHVTLDLYDLTGRRVRGLVDGTYGSGTHTERWDGRDDQGTRVAAGVYLARLRNSSEEKVQKLIRVR